MPVTYISNMHHMSSTRMLLQENFQLILQCRTLHTVCSLIMCLCTIIQECSLG